jgi:hypothetical protein
MVTVKPGAVALWADVEDRACILGTIKCARENLNHAAATKLAIRSSDPDWILSA